MSVLLLDLGNSCLKWAWLEAGERHEMQRLAHAQGTALGSILRQIEQEKPQVDAVWLVSVARTALRQTVYQWAKVQQWHLHELQVGPRALGVRCGYVQPRQLGADRWAALLAAWRQFPRKGCIVVDCGTACTLDALDASGQHLGGYILPGMEKMKAILWENTAISPMEVEAVSMASNWGRSTAECIEWGIAKSLAALVEASIERLQADGVCDPGLILTGGEARWLSPWIGIEHRCQEDLVLDGLMAYGQEFF